MGEQTLHPKFAEIVNILSKEFRLKDLNSNLAKKMTKEDLHAVMQFEEIEVEIGSFDDNLKQEILDRKKEYLRENLDYLDQFLDSKQLQLKAINTKKNIDDVSNSHVLVDYFILWDKNMFEYDKKENFSYEEYIDNLIYNDKRDSRLNIVRNESDGCVFHNPKAPVLIAPTGDVLFCYIIPYKNEDLLDLSPENAFQEPLSDIINTKNG